MLYNSIVGFISSFTKQKGVDAKLKSSIYSRLIKGGAWSLLGNICSKGILLLSTIIVSHILGKIGYGQYSIIRTTIFMFIALASVGVGATTTKYISQHRDNNIQKAYNIYVVASIFAIIFGFITSIAICYFSGWISLSQLNAPYLSDSIKYGAVLLFFCTLNGAQSGTLAGFEDFKSIAKNSLISSVIEIVSITVFTIIWGLNGALIGSGIAYMVLTILNNRQINTYFKDRVRKSIKNIKKDEISIIWYFGVPAALCNLMVIVALWITRTFLVRETNFGEIAIYNAADQIRAFILFIPTSLSAIILPVLTNIKHSKEQNSYNQVLSLNIIVNISISAFVALLICILSKPILHLWGNEYNDIIPLIILAVSAIFSSFATVVGQAIASQGKMWIGFICNLIWAVIVVVLSIAFVRNGLGAKGLALAILIAYIAHGMYQYAILKTLLKKQIYN